MSELTLMILRIGFLLLLWLFIFAIVYALRSDLFGAPVRKLPNNSSTSDGSAGRQTAAPVAATPVSAGAASQGMAPPITPSGGALPRRAHRRRRACSSSPPAAPQAPRFRSTTA